MTEAVLRLEMRELLNVLTSVQNGDFSVRFPVEPDGMDGTIAGTRNAILSTKKYPPPHRPHERYPPGLGEEHAIHDT